MSTETLSVYGTITLGALIDKLKKRNPDDNVGFTFGHFVPTRVESFRGYYDHLAIGYAEDESCKVRDLLAELEAADGKYFDGYKGGEFRMTRDTPVWVANHGESGSTRILDVVGPKVDVPHYTLLLTGYEYDER